MPETLTEKAYRHIHAQLLSGRLPPGTRLSNRAVAKEIGISFTPVREALSRLVSESLLEYRRGVGVFVPVATRREIEEIYELRETLECAAAAKACGHLPEGVLAEMAELMDQMEALGGAIERAVQPEPDSTLFERFWQADLSFHMVLLRAAGNRLALETVKGLARMSAIISHSFDMAPRQQVARTLHEHQRILEALRRGASDDVRATMAQHIRAGRQLTVAAYDRHYMDGVHGTVKGPYGSRAGTGSRAEESINSPHFHAEHHHE